LGGIGINGVAEIVGDALAVSPLGDLHLGRKLGHQRRLGAADPLGNRGDTRRQVLPGYGRFGRRLARQRIARKGASDDCDQGRNRGSAARTQRRSSNANNLQSQYSAGFPQIMRSFKETICVDISEFESSHPSQSVRSLGAMFLSQKFARHSRELSRRQRVSVAYFSRFQVTFVEFRAPVSGRKF
jgi:hypothetical protein